MTLHTLAAQLTARGVPTPTGRPVWRSTTIRNLLTNPAYKGQAASGRLRTTPARRRKSALEPVGRGVSTRAHPPEEWITVPVPALVTAEQFDLVARRLAANQRAARRSTTHPYLLRGLVSCGICRLSCSGVTRTATDTRYRYYRCRGKQAQVSSGRPSCCPARFIPATQLDELVWADLCAVLRQPRLVAQALERAHSGAWVPQELRRRQATLRQVRASVTRQRQRLLEAYLAEVIDLACFQRQDRGLAGQEADLLAREREVTAQGEQLVQVSAIAQSMTQVLEGLRVGLGQASFQQRRQLVELLIDRVVVTDGQVEIRYVIPTTPDSTRTRFCHLRTDYFHLVSAPVGGPIEVGLAALIRFSRDHRGDAATAQQPPRAPKRVALVPDQLGRPPAWLSPSWSPVGPGPLDRPTIQQRRQLGDLVALARSGQQHQRAPAPVGAQVQLGAQPAPTAPKCLILRADDPLFRSSNAGWWRAPAACWSWGSTLLLAYAERHPHQVSEIVIAGVTTSRRSEIDWLYRGARRFLPEQWERFRAGVPAADRDGDLLGAYARLLEDPDPEVRAEAANSWCAWEDALLSHESGGTANAFRSRAPADKLALVRICARYFAHQAWLEDGVLLRDAGRLAGIPAVLIHGRLDLSSPLDTAWELARAWPDAELAVIDDSGHSGSDTMRTRIRSALDRFARP